MAQVTRELVRVYQLQEGDMISEITDQEPTHIVEDWDGSNLKFTDLGRTYANTLHLVDYMDQVARYI